MLNKSWSRSLVPHLVVVAMEDVYVKGAIAFAKVNPGWFAKHPDLIAPFPNPNFEAILRGEFATTAMMLNATFPLKDRKSFKPGYKPEWTLTAFLNWELMYPRAKNAKSFSELQEVLKSTQPKLKSIIEDGEKLYFTIPLDVDYSKLGQKAEHRNSDLAALASI